MSKLISGKEAKLAWANGEDLEFKIEDNSYFYKWTSIICRDADLSLSDFERDDIVFRLKPRTIILNGIEVGVLVSSQWTAAESNKVKLEFNNKEEAHYFYTKAMEIFNNKKGSEND